MSKLFVDNLMQERDDISDWKTAVDEGVKILVDNNYSKKELADAIFQSTKDNGAYYVLEKGIALLHAPPADYSIKVGVSFMLLDKEIQFNNEDKYAKLIFTLSAPDATSHIDIIQEFGKIFTDKEIKRKIMDSKSISEIKKILKEINL